MLTTQPATRNLRENLRNGERSMYQDGSDHLCFVILATQKSLMTTARTMLEECWAISQIEGLRSGKGRSGGGLCALIISKSVFP